MQALRTPASGGPGNEDGPPEETPEQAVAREQDARLKLYARRQQFAREVYERLQAFDWTLPELREAVESIEAVKVGAHERDG